MGAGTGSGWLAGHARIAVFVSAMVKQMQKRTRSQQQERQDANQVGPMFREQEVCGNKDEADEYESGNGTVAIAAAIGRVFKFHVFSPANRFQRPRGVR